MTKIILITIVSALFITSCGSPSLNLKAALTTKNVKTTEDKYLLELHQTDLKLMEMADITVVEKFPASPILEDLSYSEKLNRAIALLEKEHHVMNAYGILLQLFQEKKTQKTMFYLAKAYFFMGEMYYEGFNGKYYEKAYNIFRHLSDKNPKNITYLRWASYAAAKTGAFIRHKERGTFSGLSYLKESINLNDQILDNNPQDEDALLTEAEYQIETDGIPIFGGSAKEGFKIFKKVLAKNPDNMRANLLMGKFFYKTKKNLPKALSYLAKAAALYDNKKVKQNMTHYYARIFTEMHRIRVYSRLKQKEKQWSSLKYHLARLPRSPSGLGILADVLFHDKQNKAAACDVMKRLVKLDPYGRKESKKALFCNEK